MKDLALITLDPAHFHAALVHREASPGVSRRVHVYAPLGLDLVAHLARLNRYNSRPHRPTAWEIEVHAGPDPLGRLLRERPGDAVILAGHNRTKLVTIQALLDAGLHVLADKPWILRHEDLPALRAALDTARARRLVLCDILPERHSTAFHVLHHLVHDPDIFGGFDPGAPDRPTLLIDSDHSLLKTVEGERFFRPVSFFDLDEHGEALTDIGIHLADLAMQLLTPEQILDPARDLRLLDARRRAIPITRHDFEQVTGFAAWPAALAPAVRHDVLAYPGRAEVLFTLRGLHVRLRAGWHVAAVGGDTRQFTARGRHARVETRPEAPGDSRRDLFVHPQPGCEAAVRAALHDRVRAWQIHFPGLALVEAPDHLRLAIPPALRTTHESRFTLVKRLFLDAVRDPDSLPAWEHPAAYARYLLTTAALDLARTHPLEPA